MEIRYESGAIQFRYFRRLSEDGTRWIRHGRFVGYYENGHIASEGEYADGKEQGDWRDYHGTGALAAQGRYEAGHEEGVWRFFAPDGAVEKTVSFRAGREQ